MMSTSQLVRPCISGFEHINRYQDKHSNLIAAKLLPGEYYVTRSDEMITTVLGSCVSVCIYDPLTKVGGMNHFMLPQNNKNQDMGVLSESFRYGDVAMERLINDLLKIGAAKERMLFKAFGGGQIIRHMTAIGDQNVKFLQRFMQMEGYKLSASDFGGPWPRKINFFPQTGKVMLRKLQELHNDTIINRESRYQTQITRAPEPAGDIDLFD